MPLEHIDYFLPGDVISPMDPRGPLRCWVGYAIDVLVTVAMACAGDGVSASIAWRCADAAARGTARRSPTSPPGCDEVAAGRAPGQQHGPPRLTSEWLHQHRHRLPLDQASPPRVGTNAQAVISGAIHKWPQDALALIRIGLRTRPDFEPWTPRSALRTLPRAHTDASPAPLADVSRAIPATLTAPASSPVSTLAVSDSRSSARVRDYPPGGEHDPKTGRQPRDKSNQRRPAPIPPCQRRRHYGNAHPGKTRMKRQISTLANNRCKVRARFRPLRRPSSDLDDLRRSWSPARSTPGMGRLSCVRRHRTQSMGPAQVSSRREHMAALLRSAEKRIPVAAEDHYEEPATLRLIEVRRPL